MDIGKKLRDYRKDKGFTTYQLGQKAGISQSTISDVENNKVSPTVDTLAKILQALDVSLGSFFEFKDLSPSVLRLIKNSDRLNEQQINKINEMIESFKDLS